MAPRAKVVTSPDEGEVTTPDDGDVTSPDEGESVSPSDESPDDHIARLLAEQASVVVDVRPTTVIMRVAISGTRDGEPWPHAGGEVTLPADEADRFIRAGYATPVD